MTQQFRSWVYMEKKKPKQKDQFEKIHVPPITPAFTIAKLQKQPKHLS